jgi:phosphoribosylglycinamide formyltransferase-1
MISGRGSNLQAVIDRFHGTRGERHPVEVCLVVSDRSSAYGLERAEKAGIDARVLSPDECGSSEEFGERLLDLFLLYKADYIVLAGYLRMIPPSVVKRFRNRIINIHPALLPFFGGKGMYGLRVHKAVLESGMKVSGATVHFVDEEYDHGPIIAQGAVPVFGSDTPESLADRVLEVEHDLLPRAIELIAEGRVKVCEGHADVMEGECGRWDHGTSKGKGRNR